MAIEKAEPVDCVFCPPNWINLDIVARHPDHKWAIIRPLNPVTEGHVLVIHNLHTANAAVDYTVSADLMYAASAYVNVKGIEANIITSIGESATQTVLHTHLHVVPRHSGDGLTLPWTGQREHYEQTGHTELDRTAQAWGIGRALIERGDSTVGIDKYGDGRSAPKNPTNPELIKDGKIDFDQKLESGTYTGEGFTPGGGEDDAS